ncbi:hypothetical protein [Alteromonas sp. 14N.309.X.WAT.G.H12]|uniref:hypothetical protein n=1 Tax=Alteromonas sp. 14N.309.X.WAT.G.H12 TaxID=3120824 RepID=UPI002FD2E85A
MDIALKNALKSIHNTLNPNRYINSSKRLQNIAMFHTGRCGSTVLGKLLKQNSNIHWDGEIFEGLMCENRTSLPSTTLKNAIDYSRNKKRSSIYGFETKYLPQQHLSTSCLNLSLEDYIKRLQDLNFNRFIILKRENYLRRAISSYVGRQSGTWHSNKNTEQPPGITLDLENFQTGFSRQPLLEHFKTMDDEYARLLELLGENALVISYEEDIEINPIACYEKVCAFFEIPAESVKISIKKTNPFGYDELLTNFESVKQLLVNTKYEWMLES